MNSKIGLLLGIAAVQVVLVAVFWFGGGVGEEASTPLVEFEIAEITAIAISDGESSIELTRAAEGWTAGGVGADDTKVGNILDKIANLDAAWPVATSSSSAERFEVTEDAFQRHVRLIGADDVLAEFYLGTSPGYQRVHARAVDSDDIFSVGLSNFELGVKVDDWMDKALLATAEEPTEVSVSVIGGDDLEPLEATLTKNDEGWLVDGVAADQDEAQTYVNRFKTLRVLGVAEKPLAPVATVSVKDTEGEFQLTLSREGAESTDYIVESTRVDGAYRIATYIAEQIMMTDVDFKPASEAESNEDAARAEGAEDASKEESVDADAATE